MKSVDHAKSALTDEFERRITRVNSLSLVKTFEKPISIDEATAPDIFEMELLELQSDVELHKHSQVIVCFTFGVDFPKGKYPYRSLGSQWIEECFCIYFNILYVCETLYSKKVIISIDLTSHYRNQLHNEL